MTTFSMRFPEDFAALDFAVVVGAMNLLESAIENIDVMLKFERL
jgi:hypothetical protein